MFNMSNIGISTCGFTVKKVGLKYYNDIISNSIKYKGLWTDDSLNWVIVCCNFFEHNIVLSKYLAKFHLSRILRQFSYI